MNWFAERRLDYIDFRLLEAGTIRREDLVRTFGVSTAQASMDLNKFLASYPNAMTYDKTAKRYVARSHYHTKRGHHPDVRGCIKLLRKKRHPLGWE